MSRRRRLVVSLLVSISTSGLLAHHGTSITYEMEKTMTVTGTVGEFDFSYPHPSLFVDVADAKGQVVMWGVEFLPTPAALKSLGWNRSSIKAGDKVVLGCHPSKSGKPVCALQSLTINGKAAQLGAGPGAPPPAVPPSGARGGQRE